MSIYHEKKRTSLLIAIKHLNSRHLIVVNAYSSQRSCERFAESDPFPFFAPYAGCIPSTNCDSALWVGSCQRHCCMCYSGLLHVTTMSKTCVASYKTSIFASGMLHLRTNMKTVSRILFCDKSVILACCTWLSSQVIKGHE